MCYKLVDMLATDVELQQSEFYPEYLIWQNQHLKDSSRTALKKSRCSDDAYFTEKRGLKRKRVSHPATKERSSKLKAKKVSQTATEECSSKLNKVYQPPTDESSPKCKNRISQAYTCNIYSNARRNELGVISKDLGRHEAKALAFLQGLPGVPKLYELYTKEDTPTSLMRYHCGTPLEAYIADGDITMALLAFSNVCKVLERIHKRGWAIYNLKADNIQVHIDKGMVCSTILDYSLCSSISINPHGGNYSAKADLPSHLPPDILEPYCRGDLVDRYSLCRLCHDIFSMMPSSSEKNSLMKTVTRGLMARTQQHSMKRPKPRHLAQAVDSLQNW